MAFHNYGCGNAMYWSSQPVYPITYFKHIADTIVLFLFMCTVLDVAGHIRNSLFQNLDLERANVAKDEIWMRAIYNMSKEGEPDEDRFLIVASNWKHSRIGNRYEF